MDYSLLIILGAFLAFIIFSNKKRSNAAKQLEASVAIGAQVIMLGGIKGTIVSILDDSVIVETTPGNKIEFVKAAVRTVVAPTLESKPKATKAVAAKSTSVAQEPSKPENKTPTKKAAK